MTTVKISQMEATRLLEMAKKSLTSDFYIPSMGNDKEFCVIGDTKKDIFVINIFRGSVNRLKYNMGARIKKNGIMLLELHINPSNVHINPNGEKIVGSHWHIYSEEYGCGWAFSANDITADEFVKNTITFLDRFNVLEQPKVNFQLELL